jgi:hypothetical protein
MQLIAERVVGGHVSGLSSIPVITHLGLLLAQLKFKSIEVLIIH